MCPPQILVLPPKINLSCNLLNFKSEFKLPYENAFVENNLFDSNFFLLDWFLKYNFENFLKPIILILLLDNNFEKIAENPEPIIKFSITKTSSQLYLENVF